MAERKEKDVTQIIKQHGKDCFVEFLNYSFEIGKVILRFIKYNPHGGTNNKVTDQIDIYVDFDEFMYLSYYVKTGAMLRERDKEGALYETKPGGISAKSLAAKGKFRPDGMALSRKFYICKGNKGYIMCAESGAGEEQGKGLIVPRYGKNPDNKVIIPIDDKSLRGILMLVESHINGFIAGQYARGKYENQN